MQAIAGADRQGDRRPCCQRQRSHERAMTAESRMNHPPSPGMPGRGKLWALLLSILTVGCNADPTAKVNATAPVNTGFLTRSMTVDGKPQKYAVFLPYSSSAEMRWPTIVF